MHAVIRSPLLCDIYSKQDRKIMNQKQLASANKEAFATLRESGLDEADPQKFINELQ